MAQKSFREDLRRRINENLSVPQPKVFLTPPDDNLPKVFQIDATEAAERKIKESPVVNTTKKTFKTEKKNVSKLL